MWCIFCNQEGMEAKKDKKGRTFLQCAKCTTRTFFHSELHAAGYEAFVKAYCAAMANEKNRADLQASAERRGFVLGKREGMKEGRAREHTAMLEATAEAKRIEREQELRKRDKDQE